MPNFAVWLHDQPAAQDADLKALQDFAAPPRPWPYWSDNLADYKNVINQADPAPANKPTILETLAQNFGRWETQQRLSTPRLSIPQIVVEHLGTIALVVFGLAIAAIIVFGFRNEAFYTSLANVDQARGLITFLFAFSTTGVIILIAIAVFWLKADEVKERFGYAKDLLTVVIGVLGTIMGFYFGQASDSGAVKLTSVAIKPSPAKPGDKITLTGQIAGGKGPYFVTIEFSDPSNAFDATKMNVKDDKIETSTISKSIQVPAEAKEATLSFTVSVKDSKGTLAQSHGTLDIKSPTSAPLQGQQPDADKKK